VRFSNNALGDVMKETMLKLAVAATLCILMGGCTLFGTEAEVDTELGGDITRSSSFGSAPESVWLEKAKKNYAEGNYGLAERFYRQAIEERRNNAEAWLGLAASYDRLKRFDLADRAYDSLIKLVGYTPTVLNNLAYHQMLRGELAAARRSLEAAAQADPGNPYVKNNMELLADWEAKAGKPG
jgi:tetratricopeptide (TPR) repeat protein